MNALAIINKYYSEENELKHILLTHSRSVADKALQIAVKHRNFIWIRLFGRSRPVARHRYFYDRRFRHSVFWHSSIYLSRLFRFRTADGKKGIPAMHWFASVTPGRMSLQSIIEQDLPIPHRDMVPVSMEGEQVICFADKFFSKTHLDREKKRRKGVEKHFALWRDG